MIVVVVVVVTVADGLEEVGADLRRLDHRGGLLQLGVARHDAVEDRLHAPRGILNVSKIFNF